MQDALTQVQHMHRRGRFYWLQQSRHAQPQKVRKSDHCRIDCKIRCLMYICLRTKDVTVDLSASGKPIRADSHAHHERDEDCRHPKRSASLSIFPAGRIQDRTSRCRCRQITRPNLQIPLSADKIEYLNTAVGRLPD